MSQHIDYEINRELGECYLFMGEFDKAAEYYQKAADCGMEHADPFIGLATVAMQQGRAADAETLYAKALSLDANDKAYAGLALAQIEQDKFEEAFQNLGSSLKRNSGNMVALNAILQLGYQLNRVADVVPFMEQALADNDNDSIRFALAGCLTCLGQTDAAREHVQVLLNKNPENSEAKELYAHIAA